MSIPRRLQLILVCLPLLAAPAAVANQTAELPADDLFTIWRTCSPTLQALPSVEVLNGEFPASGQSASSLAMLEKISPDMPLNAAGSVLSAASSSGSASLDPWEVPDRKPRKVSQKHQGLLGSLDSQVEVTDAPEPNFWDEPAWKRSWQTNENWQMGLVGRLSLFGQVGANSDEAQQTNMKVSGRTGLACKLPVGPLGEVTLRSGPGVAYSDPLRPVRQGRSDWLVEVQARRPLLFGIGLEYQGSVLPSLTPLQQDMINQDVRLAIPMGTGGKLKVGAKRQWSGTFDQRSVTMTDNLQLYLGLELTH